MIRPDRLVLRTPELTLKGRNRGEFEDTLVRNVGLRLAAIGYRWPIHAAHGRVYVDVSKDAPERLEEVLDALSEVAGVESLSASVWLRSDQVRRHSGQQNSELIEKTAVELARQYLVEGGSFAIRAKRVDKRFGMTSIEMERWLGEAVRSGTAWERVDLTRPDWLLVVEVYPGGIYFSADKVTGVGGLPVSTGGRVLALLSGGIDSPVAAFELARRGCSVDFLHLSATFAQQRDDEGVVPRLAESLSRFTLQSRLFTAPATHLDLALTGPPTGYEAILFRRFLVRVGEALAQRIGAQALVTGDSVGQVASQTLENLVTVQRATEMPILQPLIGTNKRQTIDLARRIGTYELSIEPYKDCCALLARSPRTRSTAAELERLERDLLPGYEQLIEQTLSDLVWKRFECGRALSGWMTSDAGREEQDGTPDMPVAGGSRVAGVAGDGESGSGAR